MNKSTVYGTLGALAASIALVFGTLKYSGSPVVTPTPTPAPAPAPVDPAVVVPVDPNAAKVVIDAPATAKAGDLVVFSVLKSNANSFSWKIVPETKNFLVIDGGKRAVFSGGASGDFLVIVSGAKDNTVDVKTHKITVQGSDQPPSPNDISSKVPGWADGVTSPNKRDEAMKLAQSFLSVSSTIAAGVVTSPADIVEATKRSNRDALGEAGVKLWAPFLEALNLELKSQSEAGLLTDAEAHAKAWRSVGSGLKAYAEAMPKTTSIKTGNVDADSDGDETAAAPAVTPTVVKSPIPAKKK